MTQNTHLIGLLFLLVCCCIGIQSRVSISGGQPAQLGWFPYMAGLKRTDTPFMFCGGSLIGPRHVLTAAHCFGTRMNMGADQDSSVEKGDMLMKAIPNLQVVLGRVDISTQDGVAAGVDQVFIHPNFNSSTFEHDIAVVKLSGSVPFGNTIVPINLLPVDYAVGTVLTVTGFGYVDQKEQYMPKVLQYIHVPVVTGDVCLSKNRFFNSQVQFCAGSGNGQDSCSVDSGGPAAVFDQSKRAWFQAGVVSFGGLPCGGQGVVGTYVKVGAYNQWIRQMMNA